MGSADDDNPKSRYGLSCPVGGTFYICADSPKQFLGCCDIDPCKNDGNCPAASLHSSSFSRGDYGHIPARPAPPFIGCCLENPCASGSCAPENVTAARLSSKAADAAPFLTGASSSSASSYPTTSPTPAPSGSSKGFPAGAIAGIVIGGVLAIAVIGYLLWRLQRQKKVFYHPPPIAQTPPSPQNEGHPRHASAMTYSPYKGKFSIPPLLPPPSFSSVSVI
ncbi:hypothetical protein PG994_003935 [Apiospora phragmitis]|uniref:Uncharacterized protein n=1 Tax=Apiospora phragmitis TaxID=2905665 RepID=A0ABR1VZM9_9PEZI